MAHREALDLIEIVSNLGNCLDVRKGEVVCVGLIGDGDVADARVQAQLTCACGLERPDNGRHRADARETATRLRKVFAEGAESALVRPYHEGVRITCCLREAFVEEVVCRRRIGARHREHVAEVRGGHLGGDCQSKRRGDPDKESEQGASGGDACEGLHRDLSR